MIRLSLILFAFGSLLAAEPNPSRVISKSDGSDAEAKPYEAVWVGERQ